MKQAFQITFDPDEVEWVWAALVVYVGFSQGEISAEATRAAMAVGQRLGRERGIKLLKKIRGAARLVECHDPDCLLHSGAYDEEWQDL